MDAGTWIKREQEMCQNWLTQEKRDCEVLGQQGYRCCAEKTSSACCEDESALFV